MKSITSADESAFAIGDAWWLRFAAHVEANQHLGYVRPLLIGHLRALIPETLPWTFTPCVDLQLYEESWACHVVHAFLASRGANWESAWFTEYACWLLGSTNCPGPHGLKDEHRLDVLWALGRRFSIDTRSRQVLTAIIVDRRHPAREAAVGSLWAAVELGHVEALDVLVGIAADRSDTHRSSALLGMPWAAAQGYSAGLTLLIDIVTDQSDSYRETAVEALGVPARNGSEVAIEALGRVARDPTDPLNETAATLLQWASARAASPSAE